MADEHDSPPPARRAQLVVLAPPQEREAPACATELVELGVGVSYLVPGASVCDAMRLRARRPPRGAAHVALEPVRSGRRVLLFIAPHCVSVSVDGAPVLGFSLLRAGALIEVAPGAAFVYTTYREPATIDVTAADSGRRCALCRGRLAPGVRAVRCGCGALVHAGSARPDALDESPHVCADLGDCPDCANELPRDGGHEWRPGDPFAPRAAASRRAASVLAQHLGELGVVASSRCPERVRCAR